MIKQGNSRSPLIQLLILTVISIITAITLVVYMVIQGYMGFTTSPLVVSCSSYLSVKYSSSNVFIVSFLASCLSVIFNSVVFGVIIFTFLKYNTLELLPHKLNRYMKMNKFIGLYFMCSISLLTSVCVVGGYASLIIQVGACVGYLQIDWIIIEGLALTQLISMLLSWIRIILLIQECQKKEDNQDIVEGNQQKLINQDDTRIIAHGKRFNTTQGNQELLKQASNQPLREGQRGRIQQYREKYQGWQGRQSREGNYKHKRKQLNESNLRQQNESPQQQFLQDDMDKSIPQLRTVQLTPEERLIKEQKEAAIMKELGLEPIKIPSKEQQNARLSPQRLSPPKTKIDSPQANRNSEINRFIRGKQSIKELPFWNLDYKKKKSGPLPHSISRRKTTMEVEINKVEMVETDMEKYRRPVRMPAPEKINPITEFQQVQNKIVQEEGQMVFHKKPDTKFDGNRIRKKLFENEDIQFAQQYDSVLSGFGGEVVEVDVKMKDLRKELKNVKKTKKNDEIMIEFIRSKYVEEESNSE